MASSKLIVSVMFISIHYYSLVVKRLFQIFVAERWQGAAKRTAAPWHPTTQKNPIANRGFEI
jgi:hypothetical protein